jgi:hypothetical protein
MKEPIPFAGHVTIHDFSREDICKWADQSGFSTSEIRNNIQRFEKFARLVEFFTMDRAEQ